MQNVEPVVVIVKFSFDSVASAVLFDTREEAKKFIKEAVTEENIIAFENGWSDITKYAISPDGEYAWIRGCFDDHIDTTEWHIADVFDARGDRDE